MTTKTIDLEPTWKSIYNAVRHGNLPPEELHKAVVVADVVRQAQKRGETITFHPDGTTTTSTQNIFFYTTIYCICFAIVMTNPLVSLQNKDEKNYLLLDENRTAMRYVCVGLFSKPILSYSLTNLKLFLRIVYFELRYPYPFRDWNYYRVTTIVA